MINDYLAAIVNTQIDLFFSPFFLTRRNEPLLPYLNELDKVDFHIYTILLPQNESLKIHCGTIVLNQPDEGQT